MNRLFFYILIFVFNSISYAQNGLSKIEYWFEQEKSIVEMLDSNLSYEYGMSIDTGHLSSGVHLFNYRVQDTNENWSPLYSRVFVVREMPKNGPKKVIQGEYWIDSLYNQRIVVDVVDDELSFVYNGINLSEGLHTINYRVQDSEGLYSPTNTCIFMRIALRDNSILNQAALCEYWIDNDNANMKNVPLTDNEVSFVFDASYLGEGVHTLNYRICDVLGNYSIPYNWLFVKNIQAQGNRIAWYKTWWNDHYDMADMTELDADTTDFILTKQIEVPEYVKYDGFSRKSTARFNVVFGDDAGNMSRIESFEIVYPDLIPPISSIEIVGKTNDLVLLEWKANEDDIESYNVYVSENEKPFILWLPNTTATNAKFQVISGITYRFLVTALDKAGNMEIYDETNCVTSN